MIRKALSALAALAFFLAPVVAGAQATNPQTWVGSLVVPSNGAFTCLAATCPTGTGTVTAVTGSGNIASSGGTTPNITITLTPTFTSVTATTFTGALSGNASTATSATSATSATTATNCTNCASSVSAGATNNLTASPTTGAVVVDLVASPTLTGTLTAVGVNVGGALATATTGAFSGTITDSNASAFTMSNTTANTIASAATGAVTGFIFNNTGSASTLLVDMQKNGTSEWKVSPAGATTQLGALAIGGAITGATTIGASSTITDSSASPLTFSNTGANTIASASTLGAGAFTLNNTGGASNLLTVQSSGSSILTLTSTGGFSLVGSAPSFSTGANCTTQGCITTLGGMSAAHGFLSGNNTSTGTAVFYSGSGAPSFSAPNGSLYLDYSGTPGTNILYMNTSGASSSGTTWTAKF